LIISGFLVTFFNTLANTRGVKNALTAGKIPQIPITEDILRAPGIGIWATYRLFPLTISNDWLRAVAFATVATSLYTVITMVILGFICVAGTCTMSGHAFIYFKALWTGFVALLDFPAIFFSTLIKYGPKEESQYVGNQGYHYQQSDLF
jgi:hypothetical protein